MKTFRGFKILLVIVLLSALSTATNFPQESPATRPTFEVATIKPSGSARYIPGGPAVTADYFAWNATTLKRLIAIAYFPVLEWQMDWEIKGGTPGWVDSQLWDVEARAKAEAVDADSILKHLPSTSYIDFQRITRDKLVQEIRISLMLQVLLEDRFKLRVEKQIREAPVYNLVVAKGGPKIKPDADQSPPVPGAVAPQSTAEGWGVSRGTMMTRRGVRPPFDSTIQGSAVPLARLISQLVNQAGRPIIDKTNLKGLYTFKLQWPDEASGSADSPLARNSMSLGPAFFTALQEQLGLRLESAKGPIEYLVITGVQKPDGHE